MKLIAYQWLSFAVSILIGLATSLWMSSSGFVALVVLAVNGTLAIFVSVQILH